MAKKKKPAANPARGFATTSIASKPKPERVIESEIKTPKKEVSRPVASTPQATIESQTPVKATPQTPEELEAQLERDELQLLVEKYAAKVRRDSRRQVSRFQTDQRVLRPQSQALTVQDWLTKDIFDRIITLAHAESNDSNRRQVQQPLLKVLSEEEALSRLWSLELTLRDMGFSEDHIQPVLQYICANTASIDATAGVWGFQEALEWLALNQNEKLSFSYEEPKAKQQLPESPQSSRPPTPDVDSKALANDANSGSIPKQATPGTTPPGSAAPDTENSDVAISDLDSDIEPDEVVPTYLKIKGRLFEIDPDALDANAGKSRKKSKARGPVDKAEPPAVRKLRSQLQQLESDALFNQEEADALWPAKRNQIAQAKAAGKRSEAQEPIAPMEESSPSAPAKNSAESTAAPGPEADMADDEDDDGMLGGMFAAVPDEPIAGPTNGDVGSDDVTVKDFGKQTGMSPRRILEEAVRARYVISVSYTAAHHMTI
jgi:ATP-dependent RNA helicase DHX29